MSDPQRWLRAQAERRPSALAILHAGDHVTFDALDRAADALARRWDDHLLAVQAQAVSDPLSTAIAAIAAPRAGLAFHPLSPGRPDSLPWRARDKAGELPPEAVQLIISTSGSSGAPKAAMLRGSNLAAAVTASARGLGLHPGDSWLCCMPLSAIGGLSTLFRCLEAGARVVLQDGFQVERVARSLIADRITHLSVVPAMLARLLERRVTPPPQLRAVLVGGAALSHSIAEQALEAGWPVRPTYGMSETASQIATCPTGAEWEPGLAGYPLPGFELSFTAEGRLRLRGPQLMAGYANANLEPGLGLEENGWFATGDMGWRDGSGRLWVTGRADDVLTSGGITLHPSEVENLLSQCPGIGEVAVSARPDEIWGDLLVVLFDGNISPDQVLNWSKGNLPGTLRPRQAMHIDRLPLNQAGKLDRKGLRALASISPNA